MCGKTGRQKQVPHHTGAGAQPPDKKDVPGVGLQCKHIKTGTYHEYHPGKFTGRQMALFYNR